MGVDSGAEQHDRYIGGLICYGCRPLYDSERELLVAMAIRHASRWRCMAIVSGLCAASLALAVVFAAFGDSGSALVLGMFALLIGVPAAWLSLRSRSRQRLIHRELEFGSIEAYGEPPEWNRMGGVPEHTERLIYSPVTRRALWIDGRFHENVFDSPTSLAKAPDAYHQLAASEWFDEERPAFRDLQPVEIAELRHHLKNRKLQASLGLLGLVLLVALGVGILVSRRLPPGGLVVAALSVPLVSVGWRAWCQQRELERCLESGRVGMVKQPTEDGHVIVEFLEGNGVIWSVAGSAHPWRGVRGAR